MKIAPPPRWKQYRNVKGVMPTMPDVSYGRFLLGYVSRMGWVMDGKPIPFSEIESWARGCRIPLTGWEFETLHMLSAGYAAQHAKSRKPDCPSPLDEDAAKEVARPVKPRIRVVSNG